MTCLSCEIKECRGENSEQFFELLTVGEEIEAKKERFLAVEREELMIQ